MAKINKLNSGSILSAYSKEFTQKKIILNVGGKNYDVLVDEKFKTSKLQKMILEALTNFKMLEEYDDAVKISYYMFLMVKYFTDIDITQSDDFAEQIRILNAMIDLEIFEPITSSFAESEIKKTTDYLNKFADKITELTKENKQPEDLKKFIEDEIPNNSID